MSRTVDQVAKWRSATAADLGDIQRIGDLIHTELPERPECFAEKLRLFPEGCFVLIQDDAVVGYGFSHPWLLNQIPCLNELLGKLPPAPDCMLIHDVAVLQHGRGLGAAAALIELIVRVARTHALSHLALVSVYNSYLLWARFGFEIVADDRIAEKLKSYGQSARYMVAQKFF
jgi:GNAT superfamily N-acetyltransferase